MKYILFFTLLLIISTTKSQTFDLEITITNINTISGNIIIGIFNSEDTFLKKGEDCGLYSIKVLKNIETITINSLPKGDYAISLYHDINSDKKCNTNIIKIPTEPYAFSNNYKPRFTKPSFNNCKILLNQNTSIVLKLIE